MRRNSMGTKLAVHGRASGVRILEVRALTVDPHKVPQLEITALEGCVQRDCSPIAQSPDSSRPLEVVAERMSRDPTNRPAVTDDGDGCRPVAFDDARNSFERALLDLLWRFTSRSLHVVTSRPPQVRPPRADLFQTESLPLALVDLAEGGVGDDFETVGPSDRLGRFDGAAEVTRVHGGQVHSIELSRRDLRLESPRVVQGDIGLTLSALRRIPLRLAVAYQPDPGDRYLLTALICHAGHCAPL